MKNFKFIAIVAALALFGAGCFTANKQASIPAQQNQDQTRPAAEVQWLAYKNDAQGMEFEYPSTAKDITAVTKQNGYADVIVSYDFGQTVNDPEATSIPESRLDVSRIKGSAKTQDGASVMDDCFYSEFGWTPNSGMKVQKKTYGNYEFCQSSYSDAGAGNFYSTYAYTYPMGNNEYVLFRFIVHSVNCANYEGTGFKCIPFDEARDTQLFGRILATAKLTPASVTSYGFKDEAITAKTKYYEINVAYPVMTGGETSVAKVFNAKIKSFVDAEVAQFKKDAGAAVDYPGPGPWFINYYSSIPYNKNGLVSVVLQKEDFLGGAHPNTTYKTFLYDANSSKFLSLADIFKSKSDYLGAIAVYVKDQLGKKLTQDGQPLADWFSDGTKPTADNYKDFNLTDQGLNFIFPPYQVAPYSYGTQEQVVPVDVFETYILPTGPLKF